MIFFYYKNYFDYYIYVYVLFYISRNRTQSTCVYRARFNELSLREKRNYNQNYFRIYYWRICIINVQKRKIWRCRCSQKRINFWCFTKIILRIWIWSKKTNLPRWFVIGIPQRFRSHWSLKRLQYGDKHKIWN